MVTVLVLDDTEDSIYISEVLKNFENNCIDTTNNTDKAHSLILQNSYDLIVVSSCAGKMSIQELALTIKQSKRNKKADIIVISDNPTGRSKFEHLLRGRRVYPFSNDRFDLFSNILERMSI